MSKYFLIVLLLITICAPAYAKEKKEPVYNGKTLSEWIERLKDKDKEKRKTNIGKSRKRKKVPS